MKVKLKVEVNAKMQKAALSNNDDDDDDDDDGYSDGDFTSKINSAEGKNEGNHRQRWQSPSPP